MFVEQGAPQGVGGPSPKQARLSTEGSDNEGSDSDSMQQTNNEIGGRHQTSNMIAKGGNVSTPSPASSSPPTQLTMTPSPGQTPQQQQHQQQQQQSIANSNNNMTSLPPMTLSSGISATHASALMGYSQHSFTANFGHPVAAAGVTGVLGGSAANYNQAHTHAGNMAPTAAYLPTPAGAAYSQLQGPYTWN